jgi:hypothetical protein
VKIKELGKDYGVIGIGCSGKVFFGKMMVLLNPGRTLHFVGGIWLGGLLALLILLCYGGSPRRGIKHRRGSLREKANRGGA